MIRLDTLESRIEFQARLKPASIAAGSDLPTRSSSFIRSKMSTLASTAMPIESTKPAMPGHGQGHRDEPEDGEHDERVVDEREAGDEPGQAVVDEHEEEDQERSR